MTTVLRCLSRVEKTSFAALFEVHLLRMSAFPGPAKKRKVGGGKAAKAAVEAAMAAANPEQAAANKAAEKAAKAAARREKAAEKAAAKGKGKKAADSPSGQTWGPFEAPSDDNADPEALVKSKVGYVLPQKWGSFRLLLAETSVHP